MLLKARNYASAADIKMLVDVYEICYNNYVVTKFSWNKRENFVFLLCTFRNDVIIQNIIITLQIIVYCIKRRKEGGL